MTTHFWAVPKIGTPAIQIDIDPEALGRNYPLAAARQRRRQGDACAHARSSPTAPARPSARPGSAEAQRICGEWRDKYQAALESDAVPIRPERLCHELTQHVPDDAIVVVDTGHAGMWMGGMFDLTSPRQSYMRSAGHLGWAFPAGLGAKCACPERPVVTFTGDAGFLVSHRRGRDRGALEHQRGHRRQQQWRRQSVQARLRSRLWRQADRQGARIVDFQQSQFRPPRRGHGRARHPRRKRLGVSGGAGAGARRQSSRRHRRRHRHRGAGADRCRVVP